jgi:hypothetical protein
MIVLKNTEKLVREDRAELSGDDGRKYGKGILYLTNTRLMFETESGMVARLVALHSIQSVVPVKKHEFTISCMNDDGTRIFTDRYKIRDGGTGEDWIADFQSTCDVPISPGVKLAHSKSTAEGLGNKVDSSQEDRQNVNDVVVDVNSKTLSWKKVDGWRKFPEEHIWQGSKRMNNMTKEEWLALKKEYFLLFNKMGDLHSEYHAQKSSKNKVRCRQIKQELVIVDRELYGTGNIPFEDIASDRWPEC